MNITTDDTLCWYAMSAPYNREKKAAQLLNEQGLEFFVPMRRYDKIVKASRRIKEVPVVRNLLFVHGTKKDLLKIKTDYCANDFLQFKMRTMRNGTKQHIIIPDKQMSDFMNKVQADAASELGIQLPIPEDRYFEEFYQQYNV